MSKGNKIYVNFKSFKHFFSISNSFLQLSLKNLFLRSKLDFIAFNITCAVEKHVQQLPRHDKRTVLWLTLQRGAYRNRLMCYFESYMLAGQQVTKLQLCQDQM